MGLKERIIANGMSVAEVALRAGTPPAHLYNILSGVRTPRHGLAKRIASATGGLIHWTEFFPDDLSSHQPARVAG